MQELLEILKEEHSIMDEPEVASIRQQLSNAVPNWLELAS